MNPKEIERFFKGVAKDYPEEATVYLTGAAAGALMGGVRPSMDVDFGVELKSGTAKQWDQLSAAIEKNKALTGLGSNYDEDIDRWGMITLMDYQKHAPLFKQYGKLKVRVLEPAYWSIGKMTRYLQPDIADMEMVFRKKKVLATALTAVWGKALKASPRSASLLLFRKQVEDFLIHSGPKIWGKVFDSVGAIKKFHQNAGITLKNSSK
jgi:hypothetical protein